MSQQLANKKIAFVVANEGIEQIELTRPWDAVVEAGGTPVLIAPEAGSAQAMNHLDKGDEFPVDATFADVSPEDFDAIVLPGGVANPDRLRTDATAVAWVRDFVESGRPTAVICHAPWTLVEAGVVRGRRITSWPSLQTDIRNAGGNWVDEQVVVDGNLITSRKPDDLDAFCAAFVEAAADARASSAAEGATTAWCRAPRRRTKASHRERCPAANRRPRSPGPAGCRGGAGRRPSCSGCRPSTP